MTSCGFINKVLFSSFLAKQGKVAGTLIKGFLLKKFVQVLAYKKLCFLLTSL
jgi:hypothetical protein